MERASEAGSLGFFRKNLDKRLDGMIALRWRPVPFWFMLVGDWQCFSGGV